MARPTPEWFTITEEATPQVMQRVAASVSDLPLSLQIRSAPMLAHWFLLDTLLLSNQANRDGMHANALALTRQCIEAVSIVELGVCGHPDVEPILIKWENDKLSPGKLRAWLESNVWAQYGSGLWTEPWFALYVSLRGRFSPMHITVAGLPSGNSGSWVRRAGRSKGDWSRSHRVTSTRL